MTERLEQIDAWNKEISYFILGRKGRELCSIVHDSRGEIIAEQKFNKSNPLLFAYFKAYSKLMRYINKREFRKKT